MDELLSDPSKKLPLFHRSNNFRAFREEFFRDLVSTPGFLENRRKDIKSNKGSKVHQSRFTSLYTFMLPSMHIGQAFSFVDLTGTDQITEAEAEVGFGWFWYIMH